MKIIKIINRAKRTTLILLIPRIQEKKNENHLKHRVDAIVVITEWN